MHIIQWLLHLKILMDNLLTFEWKFTKLAARGFTPKLLIKIVSVLYIYIITLFKKKRKMLLKWVYFFCNLQKFFLPDFNL